MSTFLQCFRNLFQLQHQSDVESYIISKNPKTPGDVEYWMQQYYYEHRNYLSL